jgi:sucrose PTS system EIIBCA or EIIBC component
VRGIDGVLAVMPGQNCQIVLGPGLVDRVAIDLAAAITAARSTARSAGSAATSAARLAERGAAIRQQNKQRNNTPVKNAPWLSNLTPFLGVMSTGFFALLAVFVAMNAAKEFGGTPIIGRTIRAPCRPAPSASVNH